MEEVEGELLDLGFDSEELEAKKVEEVFVQSLLEAKE